MSFDASFRSKVIKDADYSFGTSKVGSAGKVGGASEVSKSGKPSGVSEKSEIDTKSTFVSSVSNAKNDALKAVSLSFDKDGKVSETSKTLAGGINSKKEIEDFSSDKAAQAMYDDLLAQMLIA